MRGKGMWWGCGHMALDTWIMGLARLGIPQYSPNIDVLKHPAFNQSSSLYKMRLHVKVESLPKCEYKWKGVISTLHPRWVFILSDGSERPARGMLSYHCVYLRGPSGMLCTHPPSFPSPRSAAMLLHVAVIWREAR